MNWVGIAGERVRDQQVLGELQSVTRRPVSCAGAYVVVQTPGRCARVTVNHHLWVTPEEMNAAGTYINQGKGGEGLPKWRNRANRAIEKQDVVLWYSMGVTHIPRPEDWPVMPVYKVGFKLTPIGFFTRNPAMDVPRESQDANRCQKGT